MKEYGKFILAMSDSDLAIPHTVLSKLVDAYLQSLDKAKGRGASLWSSVVPPNQWLCERLHRILITQDLDTFLTTLNTTLKFPSNSEPYELLSAFFSCFPEYLIGLNSEIKKHLMLDFSWAIKRTMYRPTSVEETNLTIDTIYNFATDAKESIASRLLAFETLTTLVTHADDATKSFLIDTMLHAINAGAYIFDAALLPMIATIAQTTTAAKKAEVAANLRPYMQSMIHDIRKAAIQAVDSLDPQSVNSNERDWAAKYTRRFSKIAPLTASSAHETQAHSPTIPDDKADDKTLLLALEKLRNTAKNHSFEPIQGLPDKEEDIYRPYISVRALR
jgi:hypothetical protein